MGVALYGRINPDDFLLGVLGVAGVDGGEIGFVVRDLLGFELLFLVGVLGVLGDFGCFALEIPDDLGVFVEVFLLRAGLSCLGIPVVCSRARVFFGASLFYPNRTIYSINQK